MSRLVGRQPTERVRVVYIINSLVRGGAERFLCNFVPRLDPERFQPEVVCLYSGGPLRSELEAAGVPVHVAGLRQGVRPAGWRKMSAALNSGSIDVVHTHLPDAAWFGLPAAFARRVPVRVSHLQNCYWHWPRRLRWLDRAAASFASTVVVCSGAVHDFARDQLHYPSTKLTVMPNTVDTGRFAADSRREAIRRALGLTAESVAVLCVASLTEQKGHRFLLEAMPRVLAAVPNATLLLVGSGVEEPALRQTATGLAVDDAVRFLGERDDVAELMAGSDVFVLPSLWEGFPLVLAEAAAAGLPAVASGVDGVPEVIEDGVTGKLVAAREPEALAEALVSLLREPRRLAAMGQAARIRARERLDVGVTARELERLYLRLLSRAQPR